MPERGDSGGGVLFGRGFWTWGIDPVEDLKGEGIGQEEFRPAFGGGGEEDEVFVPVGEDEDFSEAGEAVAAPAGIGGRMDESFR